MSDEVQDILDGIQFKLASLKYTENERNYIIDATNKAYKLVYNKLENRFVTMYVSSPFAGRSFYGF